MNLMARTNSLLVTFLSRAIPEKGDPNSGMVNLITIESILIK